MKLQTYNLEYSVNIDTCDILNGSNIIKELFHLLFFLGGRDIISVTLSQDNQLWRSLSLAWQVQAT